MKKLLGIMVLGLLLSGNAFAKTLILNCPSIVFGQNLGSIYYIDSIKKSVGRVYIDKKNKTLNVYTWWFKNIIFEEKKISFNDPERGLYWYAPDLAWLAKTEIDRINIKTTHYQKDDSYDYYYDKYSYLPDIFKTKIAKKKAKWKWISTNDCRIVDIKNNKNINFISKKEWDDQQNKDNEEYDKEQAKKNKPKF
ncbi:hypothetical protein N9517_03395 [Candidatus Pelagibacter sp.]|nr:hypothetical protein [Candidatus Pelagibacter sp.]